ncbi:MAG TPA: hypothetical protein PKN95_03175 [Verrucomicrobiota bacterium]|nr:hypothetical protein [Verrucomicrobiota bacterium]HNT13314.1 hypothetical protein [Verrucomicrobiota bacterium]
MHAALLLRKMLLPLGLGLAVGLTGCATRRGPQISLVNLKLMTATPFETTAQVTLRLSNPFPDPLQLDGGVHKIYLNCLYIGEGLSHDALTLPRLGSATQEVTVHLDNFRLATRLRPIIERRRFDYRIRSIVFAAAGTARWRSENRGQLDLKSFPAATSGPPRP